MSFEFFHPFLLPEEIPNRKIHTESSAEISERDFESSFDRHPAKIKKSFTYAEDIQYSSPTKKDTSNWHRPFDSHSATKLSQHSTLKYKVASKIEKEIDKEPTSIKTEIETPSSEMHAYYFMELLQDLQDELLTEYEVIVPDVIRNDLEKMKSFIEVNAFVPMEKILELLNSENNALEAEIAE